MSSDNTMANEAIIIQNETPPSSKTHNKIWIDTDPDASYVVPTIDDFNALKARIEALERKLLNR